MSTDHQPCGLAGCASCAQKSGVSAPPHGGGGGGGHGGGGGGGHGGGGGGGHHGGGGGGHHGNFGQRRVFGGRGFYNWPGWWGPNTVIDAASCTWVPPTGRVPPSVIAALARQPFVNGWRTVYDSGWWAEQQSPNAYFVCVVSESAVGLYGLSGAAVDAGFPIWPIAIVGVVAVGIFVATLAINKKR